jgi:5,10-methylenetetrahydromethanopterin reductase
VPEATRHLAVHDLHLVGVNDHDRPFLGPELLAAVAFTPAQMRERLDRFAEQGVTEVVYQPAGPDIARELATFAEAAAA